MFKAIVRYPIRASRVFVGGIAIGGLAASIAAVAPVTVVKRFAPGVSFKINSSLRIYPGDTPRGQDDEVMRGRGVAVGGHSRIEFLAFTPAPQGVTTDDFLIGLDSGKVFVLHSSDQHLTPSDDVFGGPGIIPLSRNMGAGVGRGAGGPPGGVDRGGAGGGGGRRGGGGGPPGGGFGGRGGRGRGRGGASGVLSQMQLLNVAFNVEKLGSETFDGRPAQHYKITSDYRVIWGEVNFPAHAVTEVWTAALPTAIPNPFEPLIVADQSTDGPLIEYALKLRAVRAQLEGTPVKVITTTTFSDIGNIVGLQQYVLPDAPTQKVTVVQQTQITGVTAAEVDPHLMIVPENTGAPDGMP